MSRPLHVFSVAVLFILLPVSHLFAEHLIDRVVAVVNDDVITLTELERTGRGFFERIKRQAPAV